MAYSSQGQFEPFVALLKRLTILPILRQHHRLVSLRELRVVSHRRSISDHLLHIGHNRAAKRSRRLANGTASCEFVPLQILWNIHHEVDIFAADEFDWIFEALSGLAWPSYFCDWNCMICKKLCRTVGGVKFESKLSSEL